MAGYQDTLAIMLPALGFEHDPTAQFSVHIFSDDRLIVELDGFHAEIGVHTKAMLSRALACLRAHICDEHFQIVEKPVFETIGIMLDCSRNLVPKVETVKYLLCQLAKMGMNLAMLYTEDTYEIDGEPYFGYLRGRFSAEEIREMDDYAFALGIELVPCIQTLGHLTHMLKWDAYSDVRNTLDILLVDEEKTYAFLEKAIRAASAPYRSKRIHLGLDEADDVSQGRYRKLHGLKNATEVMQTHVTRVLEITDRAGLQPMMWSDMYFTPVFGEYYEPERKFSEMDLNCIPQNVEMVFWDYYHDEISRYDHMFELHRQMENHTIFAGGVYTWMGLMPDYVKTLDTMVPALYSAKKNRIKEVFATIWFNDGAECSVVSALYGCQLFAEFCYMGEYNEKALKERFRECCGADADAFLGLSDFDYLPDDEVGDEVGTKGSAKRSKNLLYEDPLMPLFEKDFENVDLVSYYARLAEKYRSYADEAPEYRELYMFAYMLADLLHHKAIWRREAPKAIRAGARDKAAELARFALRLKCQTEAFAASWRSLWHTYNKPFGFELNDIRIGGVAARFATAAERMQAYADGKLDDIEELSCEKLPFSRYVEGAPKGCVRKQTWHSIASVNTLGGYTNLRS